MREKILIVDDEEASREFCRMALQEAHRELVVCPSAEEALQEISRDKFDLVITDMVMPGISGLDLLARIKAERSDTAVLLMSGKGTISAAVDAMKLGAEDFIEKPFPDPEFLAMAVNKSLKARRLERENQVLRRELQKLRPHHQLIGGEAMSQVLRTVEKIAPLDVTVLITGETGTGKEVIARRIHDLSPRSSKPFIALNCGGLPEGILESLLFGHERGSFTGAVKRTHGYFEKAHGGSIFLDEIGDMPYSLQIKLLRVLQEKAFQRVGGDSLIEADCRVIAATHRNLRQMVAEDKFREDLYYRLSVLPIRIPPLRERGEDIPALAQHFIRLASAKLGRTVSKISPDALRYLRNYHWPGNVRELENVIERAVALSTGEQIGVPDLPDEIIAAGKCAANSEELKPYQQAKRDFERRYILSALEKNAGNISAAARASGIPRQNFYMKMKKLGINR